MRAYTESAEEALRARNLLKDWAGEALITDPQYRQMEQETVCDLRRTNIFLRLVLFIFTLIVVGAGVGLFFTLFVPHSGDRTTGVVFLFIAAASYAATEVAVSQYRLYRYGIEEALAACSVGFLCAGIQLAFFRFNIFSSSQTPAESMVPAAGAILSLWIWHRFGLPYAFLAAMIFAAFLPGYWTSSHTAQHLIVAALYAAGLIAVAWLKERYSIAEALLWLGLYLTINLRLGAVTLTGRNWWNSLWFDPDVPKSFYWTTWVLTWLLPPVILARGVHRKDRFVIGAGWIAAILTLIANKPYLDWPRHTWDPMLLGALLMGVALLIRRWLAKGPGGIRHGFTAQRLSGKDKSWMSAGTAALGLASPHTITPAPNTVTPQVRFGGGDSGGGGATSDY